MKYVLLLLFFWVVQPVMGQVDYTSEDEAIFARYMEGMVLKQSLPINELIIETALFFLGTPYVASTLEKEPEQLVVNLRAFDCTTLVENCMALARTLKGQHPTFVTFCRELQAIRYRAGRIDTYTSRLHYTSDWIIENRKQGRVDEVAEQMGGEPHRLTLSFMSAHPDKYPGLKDRSERVLFMRQKEQEINEATQYYIPKGRISCIVGEIKDGDMIAFTTSLKGLDVTHVGYAYWNNGQLTFIHASTTGNNVIVNPVPLVTYCQQNKYNTGIIVVRPLADKGW